MTDVEELKKWLRSVNVCCCPRGPCLSCQTAAALSSLQEDLGRVTSALQDIAKLGETHHSFTAARMARDALGVDASSVKTSQAIAQERDEETTNQCPKCGGVGWVWAHELDTPPAYFDADRSPMTDDTKYQCDHESHTPAIGCADEGGK